MIIVRIFCHQVNRAAWGFPRQVASLTVSECYVFRTHSFEVIHSERMGVIDGHESGIEKCITRCTLRLILLASEENGSKERLTLD